MADFERRFGDIGLYPDNYGNVDPTGTNYSDQAFSDLFTAVERKGGAPVYVAPGTYKFSETWEPPNVPFHLYAPLGDMDFPLVRLNFAQTDGTPCVYLDGTSRANNSRFSLQGLYIAGNDDSGPCLKIKSWAKYSVRNVRTLDGSYGFWLEDAYIGTFTDCKAFHAVNDGWYLNGSNENMWFGCMAIANRGWGMHIVSGGQSTWIGDISESYVGNIWVEQGQDNWFRGYSEAAGNADILCQLDKPTFYNKIHMWAGANMAIIDNGVGNDVARAQGIHGVPMPQGSIQNLIKDSSFESVGTGNFASSNVTITQDTGTGVLSGCSMKLVATSGSNAIATYHIAAAGVMNEDDVVVVTGWAKASKAMNHDIGTNFKIQVSSPGQPTFEPEQYIIPHVDTTWRPFGYVGRCPADMDAFDTNLVLTIANPTAADAVWVTDLQVIRNPPKGFDPLLLPYIHNIGTTRSTVPLQADLTEYIAEAPSTAASTGRLGQWSQDGSYLYVATGTNTWKRVAVATW